MTPRLGARIGYARVSSTDQNLARHLATLGDGDVDKLYEEKQSGAKRAGRAALANLFDYARDGDEFQLNIMASFAQLERAITKQRQADGIRAAKERGAYRGRSRKLTTEQLATARDLIDTGVPKAEVARRLDIDRTTLYRTLARQA